MKRLLISLMMLFGVIGTMVAEESHATVKVSSENFAELRQNTPLLVVDFWATWCGPCLRLAPILEEVAATMKGKVVIGKCDVDENRALAQSFGIRSIPTLIFFKDGKKVEQHSGLLSREALIDKINAHL